MAGMAGLPLGAAGLLLGVLRRSARGQTAASSRGRDRYRPARLCERPRSSSVSTYRPWSPILSGTPRLLDHGRQPHRERGAASVGALDGEVAAHQPAEVAGDR
jgi:hypothetical protein